MADLLGILEGLDGAAADAGVDARFLGPARARLEADEDQLRRLTLRLGVA
jgi:hypothetical protein